MVQYWQSIYQQEIDEIHDWLLLSTQVANPSIITGDTSIHLTIHNDSKVVARKLHLSFQVTEGIQWQSHDFSIPGLIDIDSQQTLVILASIEAQARVVMNGLLTAEDLEGREYQWLINLELNVNRHGKPYQRSTRIYYIVGPRLNRDDEFTGREQLIPVYVDLQGQQNLHDFYRAVVKESCQLLSIAPYLSSPV